MTPADAPTVFVSGDDVLSGYQSIRVTERHYSPWTRSR
jgi:hypothetical protein